MAYLTFPAMLVYSLATKHNAKKEILFSASLQLILLQHRLDSLHQTVQTLLQARLAPIPRIGNMSIAMFVRLPGCWRPTSQLVLILGRSDLSYL